MTKEIDFVPNNFLTTFSLFFFYMNIKFYTKNYKNKIYNAMHIGKFNKTKFELKFKDNVWH